MLFICSVSTLPVLSPVLFTIISPEVILMDGVRNRVIFVRYETCMSYDSTVATYKHPYISHWKHTRSFSFSALPRPAHRSAQTDRTSRRCRSRPGYRPALLACQPMLRPLLHCPVLATPSSTPDFLLFSRRSIQSSLCVPAASAFFVFHNRTASRNRFLKRTFDTSESLPHRCSSVGAARSFFVARYLRCRSAPTLIFSVEVVLGKYTPFSYGRYEVTEALDSLSSDAAKRIASL